MVTPAEIPAWLAPLYPFAPRAFGTPSGARMSYVDAGPRGDHAIVFLHGNPTWSFYYRELVGRLSARFRCLAPDHIGMGLSDKPAGHDYTLAGRIADLDALILSLGLRRVDLVVHDWGGAIGFGWASRRPEMLGRAVLFNTAAFPSTEIPARIALCRLPGLGPLLVRGANGFAGPATHMAMRRRALSEVERRAYLFPYDTWSHRVGVDAFVRDIPLRTTHPSWGTLAAASVGLNQFRAHPVRIIWGGADFCFNDRFLARWKQIFPQAQVTRIADAGHYVLEDADEAGEAAAEFLERPA